MASKPVNIVIKGEYQDKDINRAIGDLKKLQAASVGMGQKMQNVGGQMQSMGRAVGGVGRSLTLGLTLPIVGIGTAAVLAGADFEKSMNKVRAVSGVTGKDFDSLKEQAKELGRTTQFSASQAADGMTFLAMAGFKTNEILTALPATLNLAAAGELELAEAADIASNVLGGFRLSAGETNRVVDVMAQVARNANTSVRDMGTAMSYVGPVASAAGISIETTAAFIGRLGDAGIQSSRAGTTLVGIIGKLANQTPKAAKRLKELGIVTHDSAGNMKPLDDIVQQLGNSSITAGDYLAIFGQRAGPGMAALVGMGTEGLANLTTKAHEAGGAAQEMAEVQLEGLRGQMVKLKSAFEGLLIAIAESGLLDRVTDFFTRLTEKVSELVQRVDAMSPRTKNMILLFAGLAAALGPVLMIVGKLLVVIGTVIKIAGVLVAAFNPVTLAVAAVVVGIGLLVAAFKLAWDSSATLRKAVGDLMATVQNIARVIVSDLVAAFQSIIGEGSDLRSILDRVREIMGPILTRIVQNLTKAFEVLGNIIRAGIKIFEAAYKVIEVLVRLIVMGWIASLDILMNKLGPVSTAFRAMLSGVRGALTTLVSAVAGAFNTLGKRVEFFINLNIKAINALIGVYNALADKLGGVSKMSEIAEFRFQNLSAAVDVSGQRYAGMADSAAAASRAADATSQRYQGLANQFAETGTAATDAALNVEDLGKALDDGKGGKSVSKSADKAKDALKRFQSVFQAGMKELQNETAKAQKAYEDMAEGVSKAIFGIFTMDDADPNRIGENGEKVGGTWLDGLKSQATKAIEFAQLVSQAIAAGLKPGSELWTMTMGLSKDKGIDLLTELVNGGATYIQEANDIIEGAKTAADRVGLEAADQFEKAGLDSAKKTEEGFAKRFGKDGPGWNKLNNLMSALARSLSREAFITVKTVFEGSAPDGKRAMGGPVAANKAYIVGEKGPELLVMGQNSGDIIPNHDLTKTMTGRVGSAGTGGASSYAITVNAGMGTDGASVGRQVVEAIRQYERQSGKVFVAA
jgi:TP901 family phage tail tape measure protein